MNRFALIPAVIAAAAASGIAIGAAPANAACPAPKVVVTAAHSPITAGTQITLHGYNFDCAATGTVIVYPEIYSTSTGQQGNGPQIHVSKAGEWTYTDAAPSTPGPVTVRVDGAKNAPYSNADAFQVVATTTAAPANPLPTAVPAGHVDVSHNTGGGSDSGAVELVGLAGLVLVGVGAAAGARRRQSRHLNG